MYIMEFVMQVSKWGNSLAVRLPKALVDELGLSAGDEVEIVKMSAQKLVLTPKLTREEALKRLWETRIPLPAGFKFNRDEANER
jgi:antitoxin MazE